MDSQDFVFEMMHNLRIFSNKVPQFITHPIRGEKFILNYLLHSNTTVIPSDISSSMETSTARTAAALNALEDKKLITRDINKDDRRQILVSLTDEGRQLAESYEKEYLQKGARLFEVLGEQDAKEFLRIVGKIAKHRKEIE